MSRSEAEGIDATAVRDSVERALNAMEQVQTIKSYLTGAQNQIGKGKDAIDAMAALVRDHLNNVDRLVLAGSDPPEADEDPAPAVVQESLV